MIGGWVLLLVSLGYVGAAVRRGVVGDTPSAVSERTPGCGRSVYALALAVYCSSWTFYGAVGTAVRNRARLTCRSTSGRSLLFVFGWRILERLVLDRARQNTVSIADFLSSRYGTRARLAALVTLIALIAAVPYLALQFKAVAMSVGVLTGTALGDTRLVRRPRAVRGAAAGAVRDPVRHPPDRRHRTPPRHDAGDRAGVAGQAGGVRGGGRVRAVAPAGERRHRRAGRCDHARPPSPSRNCRSASSPRPCSRFPAIVCLPRQFHVAVVECQDVRPTCARRAGCSRGYLAADQRDGGADRAGRAWRMLGAEPVSAGHLRAGAAAGRRQQCAGAGWPTSAAFRPPPAW